VRAAILGKGGAAAALVLAAALSADAEATGSAKGTLTIAGKTIPLSHSFVLAQPASLGNTGEELRLILSDVPVSGTVAKEPFGLQTLAREGKLNAVEITVDAEKKPIGGGVYAAALSPFGGFVSVAGVHTLLPEAWDGKTASGKASMAPFTVKNVSFQYSASFSSPVWRQPPPLSGAAARNTEPGRAIVALITAARKGDRAAVRNLLLPEVVKDLDGPDGGAVMELLSTMADKAVSEITVEIVDADTAKGRVTKREGSSSESTGMTVKRVGGVWKISL
jgi:hypothetical protein